MTQLDSARSTSKTATMAAQSEMLELYQPMLKGMTVYSGALCDGYAKMGTEWLNFVNRRLHSDLSLPGRLVNCCSPQHLFQEWATFMATAAEDYRNEFARLAELNSAASQRALLSVRANGESRPGPSPRNA